MSETPADSTGRDARLQEVLLAYLRAVDGGTPPDRDELLRRHADLADDLRTFFADQDRLDPLAAPLPREPPARGGGPGSRAGGPAPCRGAPGPWPPPAATACCPATSSPPTSCSPVGQAALLVRQAKRTSKVACPTSGSRTSPTSDWRNGSPVTA